MDGYYTPILKMRKMTLRKIKQIAQVPKDRKWQAQNKSFANNLAVINLLDQWQNAVYSNKIVGTFQKDEEIFTRLI